MENTTLKMDGNLSNLKRKNNIDGLNHQHLNVVTPDRKHIQVIMRIGIEMKKPTIRRLSLWDELNSVAVVKETVYGLLAGLKNDHSY